MSSEHVWPRQLGLVPGGRIAGTLSVPGSKSLAQRLLVVASLCGGRNRISALPDRSGGDDVRAARDAARVLAREYEVLAPAAVAITGNPPGPYRGWNPSVPVDVGESGTLARLVLASLALCGHAGREFELEPRGTLVRRSSRALVDALRASGVEVAARDGGDARATFALRVRALGPPSRIAIADPGSSQEVSALLIALAAYPDANEIVVHGAIPSRPYLDMTIALLTRFGVAVTSRPTLEDGAAVETFHVRGPLTAREEPWIVEPDASSAAVALAAACLSDGDLAVPGLDAGSTQGDVRIVEHLAAFGCGAGCDDRGLFARGFPLRGAELDLAREPDLAPVLAAIAGAAALRGGNAATSTLRGLGTLPGKESSRIEVLAGGLAAVGLAVEHGADFLRVAPASAGRGATEIVLDPRGDHRMAFAFALLGLARPGILVRDPGCVAKSWPGFWRDLERAGARVRRVD